MYLSISQAARELDRTRAQINYAIHRGIIEPPKRQIGKMPRKYYDLGDVAKIRQDLEKFERLTGKK